MGEPGNRNESIVIIIPGALSKYLTPSAVRSRHVKREWVWSASKALKTKVVKCFDEQAPDARTIFSDAASVSLAYVVARGKGRQAMDADNLISTLKYVQDGIARAIGVDDRHFVILPPQQIRSDNPEKPYISVTVRRLE